MTGDTPPYRILPADRPSGPWGDWLAVDADGYVIADGTKELCEEVVARRLARLLPRLSAPPY